MLDFESVIGIPLNVFMDIAVSIMCGFLGLCFTTVFIYSNPKRKLWITLPQRMRRAILVGALFWLWRSANLSYIAPTSLQSPGHINAEGFMLTLALTWLAVEVVYYVMKEKLKDSLWDRLSWMLNVAHKRPEVAEVGITAAAVEEAKAIGIVVMTPDSLGAKSQSLKD